MAGIFGKHTICGNFRALLPMRADCGVLFTSPVHIHGEILMSLSPEEVRAVAHLARLAVDEQRIPDYSRDLSRILELVEQMQAVDTASVEAMAHPLDMAQRLRPDEVTEPNQRERFQAIAPAVEDGVYLVPRVIE
jgi:aspartyl-tRNA(Asn)/glutamyl-tRNA(Gln) amidotransferase subunit C